jgi:hypothetical protein
MKWKDFVPDDANNTVDKNAQLNRLVVGPWHSWNIQRVERIRWNGFEGWAVWEGTPRAANPDEVGPVSEDE